eukprot:TRINITY_DN1524_c0_g2_i1.p2 TRINITY_DN1524_c0_g2~~TRINITY_DN1524_c0_g2_i1.p2  ORF type:complete len:101 (-),score=23.50 TRINITY_DN1524_c0_g2_i1:145-447(-)
MQALQHREITAIQRANAILRHVAHSDATLSSNATRGGYEGLHPLHRRHQRRLSNGEPALELLHFRDAAETLALPRRREDVPSENRELFEKIEEIMMKVSG